MCSKCLSVVLVEQRGSQTDTATRTGMCVRGVGLALAITMPVSKRLTNAKAVKQLSRKVQRSVFFLMLQILCLCKNF